MVDVQSVDEDVVVVDNALVVVVASVVVVAALVVVGTRKLRRPRPFLGSGIDGSVAREMTPRSQCVVVDVVVVVVGSSVDGSSRQMMPCCSVVGISSFMSNALRTHGTSISIRAQIEYESPGSNLFNDVE